MVQSIWLKFKDTISYEEKYQIINEVYPLCLYNEVEEPSVEGKRWSIEQGYTIKDITFLEKLSEIINIEGTLCDCEFCKVFKSYRERVIYFFGISFQNGSIGRNIWGGLGYDIFTSRLRLLYCFLKVLMNLFRDKGYKCYLYLGDCPDIKKEIKALNEKIGVLK